MERRFSRGAGIVAARICFVGACVVGVGVVGIGATPSVARAEIVDRVAAVVNGRIVLMSEAEEHASGGRPPGALAAMEAGQRTALLKRAVEDLVAERLLMEVAETDGLKPSSAEIDSAIDNVKRENRIDDATLATALAQQGLTMEGYREMLTKQLTQMKVAEVKVRPRVNISEDDVRRRYEEMTKDLNLIEERLVRDIFVPSAGDPEGARAQAQAALERVRAGEPFETVARETGGPLAEAGGALGWVKPGTMLPGLDQVALGLGKGGVSEVVELGGGFHVLLVEDVRASGGARPLSEAREEIRSQLFAERMTKATEDYLDELRRTADVEIRWP